MNLNKIINQGLLFSLILIASAIPFSIAITQLSLGLAIFFWLLKLIVDYKSELLLTPITIPFLIWVLVSLITALVSGTFKQSILSSKEEWLFLGFFVVWGGINKLSDWHKVVYVLLLATSLSAIYSIWQHYSGIDLLHQTLLLKMEYGYRAKSTLSGTLTAGAVFSLISIFALPLVLNWFRGRKQIIILAPILSAIGACLTYSRSAILAFGIGIFGFFLTYFRQFKIKVIIISISLLIAVLLIQPDFLFRFSKENPISEQEKTYLQGQDIRWQIWSVAWKMFLDNPVVGVGQGNFLLKYNDYREDKTRSALAHAHNDILHMAASKGIIGVLAYILIWLNFIVILIRYLRSNDSQEVRNSAVGGGITDLGVFVAITG